MTAGTLHWDSVREGGALRLFDGDEENPPGDTLVFAGPDMRERDTSVGGVVEVRRERNTYAHMSSTTAHEGRMQVLGEALQPAPGQQRTADWTGELSHDAGSDLHARRAGRLVLRTFDPASHATPIVRLGGRVSAPGGAAPEEAAREQVTGRKGDLRVYDTGSLRAQLWIDDSSTGRLTLRDEESGRRVQLGIADDGRGYLHLFERTREGGRLAALLGAPPAEIRDRVLMLLGERGTATLGVGQGEPYLLLETDEGSVRLEPSGLSVSGDKSRFLNSFVARHPEDESREIRYTVLEGPEAGTYVRGSAMLVEGCARVPLPDHFRHVTSDRSLTVQLTPRSRTSRGVCASELTTSVLVIEELGGGAGCYEVDYQVNGIRRGLEGYEVVRVVPEASAALRR